jgi:hypothetical protein
VLPSLIRAFEQGGKELENTRDLADRAFALDAYADVTDPSFEYVVSFGRAAMSERLWEDPPFMVVHETRGDRRVSAEAWLRPEANASASCGFTDDDVGEKAREQVREAYAAGEPVELAEGLWMQVQNAPLMVKERLDSLAAEGSGNATSIAEFDTPPVRLVTKEKGSTPGKTRVRLRTEPTSIPFRFVTDEPAAISAPSSRIWTPRQGPSGPSVA